MSEQEQEIDVADLRSRLRALFLNPDYNPEKPDTEGLSPLDKRRTKIHYQKEEGGRFRTWVYLVALLLLIGLFAWFVSAVG